MLFFFQTWEKLLSSSLQMKQTDRRGYFHAVTSGGYLMPLTLSPSSMSLLDSSSCEVSLSYVARTWSAEENNLLKGLFSSKFLAQNIYISI